MVSLRNSGQSECNRVKHASVLSLTSQSPVATTKLCILEMFLLRAEERGPLVQFPTVAAVWHLSVDIMGFNHLH